jgi:DHA1 family multidrug resistance protein-like MFS transporter
MSDKTTMEKSKTAQMYGLGIVSLFLSLSSLIGIPVLPRLSEELGAADIVIPIILSSALVTVVILQFFTGALSDRYSRKNLILIGVSIGSVSSLLILAVTSWWQLLTLRIIGGVADAIAMPAVLSITATLGERQPGKFFGILRASQGLSYAIGPLIGGIFSLISLRIPFLVDGILSIITFVIVLFLVKNNIIERTKKPTIIEGLKTIFSQKRIYLYLLMGISAFFGFGILSSFVPTKAQLIGLDAWQISLIMSFGAILYSGISLLIGNLSERYGRKGFVVFSQITIIVSSIGFIFLGDSGVWLLVFYGIFCIGEATAFLLSFVYATKLFSDNRIIGLTMGSFDSIIDFSLFLGPLIGILVYGLTNEIWLVFLLVCIPAVLGLFIFNIWLKNDR